MKKLNIKIAMILFALMLGYGLQAQDYKVDISNPAQTTIVIKEVNKVSVEAYSGSDIEVYADSNKERSERAVGLTALSARGQDNTGIGLNIKTEGNEVTISQVARRGQGRYTIKVPENVSVQIEHTGDWEGGKIEIYGTKGELEVSGNYNPVYMEDVTGPALVSTVYGKVEATFAELSQSGPTSIVSIYGIVDVTLPGDTKANLTIQTPYGEAFSDMNIEFPSTDGMKKVSSTVKGTINGGGVDLDIKASYKNVYLRKK